MKPSIRSLTLAWAESASPARIDREALKDLRGRLAEELGAQKRISNRYLVEILLETTLPIDAALGGVAVDLRGRIRTREPEAALEVLAELGEEYETAAADRRGELRMAVLRAKQRLALRLRRAALQGSQRRPFEELQLAVMTWLENPAVFAGWLAARRRARGEATLVD
jgi:hypothetical protein